MFFDGLNFLRGGLACGDDEINEVIAATTRTFNVTLHGIETMLAGPLRDIAREEKCRAPPNLGQLKHGGPLFLHNSGTRATIHNSQPMT